MWAIDKNHSPIVLQLSFKTIVFFFTFVANATEQTIGGKDYAKKNHCLFYAYVQAFF